MTVRFEALSAETLVSRTVADAPSATSEKLNDVERVRNGGINRRAKSSLGGLGLSVRRDIQPSI